MPYYKRDNCKFHELLNEIQILMQNDLDSSYLKNN